MVTTLEMIINLLESYHAIIGLVILVGMFVGFTVERFPVPVVAILGVCAFLFLGALSEEDLLSALSNPAPLTIGAMFILSGALLRTGMLDAIANRIILRARQSPRIALVEIYIGAFVASAFLNNTPVVLVMIPIVVQLAKAMRISNKLLLIPLSYVCILGGTMTLIGTSTNLLVDAVAREEGMEPLGIFTITPFGFFAALAGLAALLIFSRHLLPDEQTDSPDSPEESRRFLTEIRVTEESNYIGRRLGDIGLAKRANVDIVALWRGARYWRSAIRDRQLEAGDRLVARVNMAELVSLRNEYGLEVGVSRRNNDLTDSEDIDEEIVEATIAPGHPAIGRRLKDIPFLSFLGVRILGLSRSRDIAAPDLANARIYAIDQLVVTGAASEIKHMYNNPNLFGVSTSQTREFRRDKAPIAIAALVGAVLLATFGIMEISLAAVLGVGLILFTRCIDAEEAWNSIDGNVLVLIFAMLAIGVALQNAGSVALIVNALTPWLRDIPPWGLIIATYIVSVILTEIVTNNAVAVLITPLAIGLARELGMDPFPVVIAVMFAASASFVTPIGYQTNTLVYAAGNYRFTDFVRAGIPMALGVGAASCTALIFLA